MTTSIEKKSVIVPDLNELYNKAIILLKNLISIPSFSGEEQQTANLIASFLKKNNVFIFRKHNNIWCYNKYFDENRPTVLLNSHHDTVKPSKQYTRNPFEPTIENERIYGLGSNDAGGPLVSLISTFLYFYEQNDLPFNLCLATTAEEENSGNKGIKSILEHLKPIAFAIVGEPTCMEMAISEKGSMVLDCHTKGVSGHAARDEGDNAIYKALKDINWFSTYQFPTEDNAPQSVKMSVTEIHAGIQHNIIPADCSYCVDIRFDHNYTQKEIINTIINHTDSNFKVRSNVLQPSSIDLHHPLIDAGLSIGRKTYASPTSSDQGWLHMPSLKIGPGNSSRSHTADEFISIEEIEEGISLYIKLLRALNLSNAHS